jgi:hypothetical protein
MALKTRILGPFYKGGFERICCLRKYRFPIRRQNLLLDLLKHSFSWSSVLAKVGLSMAHLVEPRLDALFDFKA